MLHDIVLLQERKLLARIAEVRKAHDEAAAQSRAFRCQMMEAFIVPHFVAAAPPPDQIHEFPLKSLTSVFPQSLFYCK